MEEAIGLQGKYKNGYGHRNTSISNNDKPTSSWILSVPVSVELLPPLPTTLPLGGTPGLGRAVFGDAHPGEPTAMAGDFSLPGEADGECNTRLEDPITWGDFMEADEGVPAPDTGGRG